MRKFVLIALLLGGFFTLFSVTLAISHDQSQLHERSSRSRDQNDLLQSGFREMVVDGRRAQFRDNEVLVKFRGDRTFRRMQLRNESVEQALTRYGKRSDVEYAEPNYIATAQFIPNDTFYSYQWHFDNNTYGGVHAEAAWNVSTGAGVTVAIVDSGVAYENYSIYSQAPDLVGTAFAPGYDFVNNDSHPNDDEAHGTHVAGTVAQSTNNSYGIAGLAHGATIMPVKVLSQTGSGSYADVANGVIWAVDNGADVINMSLGGPVPSVTLENAVAYAYNNGVVVVAAAGNSGANGLQWPAAYDNYVIGVGATRFDETKASYSNYGTSLDIVAPGGQLSMDQNNDGYGDGVLQQTFGSSFGNFGYYFYQGTSMATPHVAAVAALVIANGNAKSPDEVRAALESTADDLGSPGRDDSYGWGLVNASAALQYQSTPSDDSPTVAFTNPSHNDTVSGNVLITASAADDNSVSRVDFYVDGGVIGSDTSSPYTYLWNSTGVPDGDHILRSTAVDSIGQETSDSITVTVDNTNDAPVADAGPDLNSVVNTLVSFNGSNSFDPDGSVVSYDWNFGDDSVGQGTSVQHTYTASGVYLVTLTVTDNDGLSDSDTLEVTIDDTSTDLEVFSDSFEDGEWNNKWTEDGQRDWKDSRQRAVDGRYSAEIDGSAQDAALTSIVIDLQGRSNATISFSWWIESYLDSGEYLAFDVSTDGGSSWTEYARLRGNVDTENEWHNPSFEVSGISDVQLRFRGSMNRSNEDADVDMVRVVAW